MAPVSCCWEQRALSGQSASTSMHFSQLQGGAVVSYRTGSRRRFRGCRADNSQQTFWQPHRMRRSRRVQQECLINGQQMLANGTRPTASTPDTLQKVDPRVNDWEYVETPQGVLVPLMALEDTESDPSTNKILTSSSHSIASFFTADDWEYHQSAERYFRNLFNISESTVYRRILAPCLMITAFSAFVAFYNSLSHLHTISFALAPHTLLGSALSLLLVFRTNASYGRLVEGRRMWGAVVRNAREWVRLTTVYFPEQLQPEALAFIQAFAIVLKGKVRPGRTRSDASDPTACRYDVEVKLRKVLGPEAAAYILGTRNSPGVVARALSRNVIKAVQWPSPIPFWVAQRCEDIITELVNAASGADRLFQTPIPVSYTRHTSRSLMLWLLTLPFALWPVMGSSLVPACFFLAYVLIGIDELGVQIEEPSAILPLVPLLNKIRFEVQAAVREHPSTLSYAA